MERILIHVIVFWVLLAKIVRLVTMLLKQYSNFSFFVSIPFPGLRMKFSSAAAAVAAAQQPQLPQPQVFFEKQIFLTWMESNTQSEEKLEN